MEFLIKKQYTMLQPPYLMRKDIMAKTAQLEQFDEELYKVYLCSIVFDPSQYDSHFYRSNSATRTLSTPQMITRDTSSPPVSSPSLLSMPENGSSPSSCPSDTEVSPHVSERRQELTERTSEVSSESTSSRKLSSSASPAQKIPGK